MNHQSSNTNIGQSRPDRYHVDRGQRSVKCVMGNEGRLEQQRKMHVPGDLIPGLRSGPAVDKGQGPVPRSGIDIPHSPLKREGNRNHLPPGVFGPSPLFRRSSSAGLVESFGVQPGRVTRSNCARLMWHCECIVKGISEALQRHSSVSVSAFSSSSVPGF